jgi:uncharacterized protein YwgA
MDTQDLRLAILHEVISELDDVGKTQLQKLGYFLQEAFSVPTKYSFRMHHYGPYAEALETDIARLRLTGYVDIQPDPQGYGFHITSIDNPPEEWSRSIQPYVQSINDVIKTFGSRKTPELELAATIHFTKNLLSDASTDEVLSKVKALKPKFDGGYISKLHAELEEFGLLS